MKTSNYIKSMVFLIAILFSFSVSAYNSLNNLSLNGSKSFKTTQMNQSSNDGCVSDNIFFEEQEFENDNESYSPGEFFVLSYFYRDINSVSSSIPSFSASLVPVASQPLFISIRVLRI